MTRLCFVDTETTGLDPERHEIWEVGLIVRETGTPEPERTEHRDGAGNLVATHEGPTPPPVTVDVEYVWQLPVDEARADLIALNIGGYHERRWPRVNHDRGHELTSIHGMAVWARRFADLTWGAHLVGAVVSFDEQRLRRLLLAHGVCPGWHYHLIDVEALAVGWLHGSAPYRGVDATDEEIARVTAAARLPWKSEDLSRAVGVDPDAIKGGKHTALGDARWARALYDAVMP